eukprot:COSAG01_NODE_28305_length_664_cov_1.132743_1_plen_39_part_10
MLMMKSLIYIMHLTLERAFLAQRVGVLAPPHGLRLGQLA